ncbi:unnamed protein product, partial [Brenthis ino]
MIQICASPAADQYEHCGVGVTQALRASDTPGNLPACTSRILTAKPNNIICGEGGEGDTPGAGPAPSRSVHPAHLRYIW